MNKFKGGLLIFSIVYLLIFIGIFTFVSLSESHTSKRAMKELGLILG